MANVVETGIKQVCANSSLLPIVYLKAIMHWTIEAIMYDFWWFYYYISDQ